MEKSLIKIFTLSVISLLIPLAAALAVGQMTQPIVVANALRGQEIEKELKINNSATKDLEFGLIATGDIEGWATFYLPNDLQNPITSIKMAASSKAKAITIIKVPDDTPNGTYVGSIAVTLAPADKTDQEGSSVSITQRIDREVTITVTDKENIDFDVSVIPVSYLVEPEQPLKIRFIYDNKGNVKITPQIGVKIKDINRKKVLASLAFPYPDGEEAVKPLSRHEIPTIDVPTAGLKNGRYWIELSFSERGQVIEEQAFRFTLGSQEAVLGAMFGSFKVSTIVITAGAIIGVVILAVLIFIARQLYLGNKKKRGKSKTKTTL